MDFGVMKGLKTKFEESTCLACTLLCAELEHLKMRHCHERVITRKDFLQAGVVAGRSIFSGLYLVEKD